MARRESPANRPLGKPSKKKRKRMELRPGLYLHDGERLYMVTDVDSEERAGVWLEDASTGARQFWHSDDILDKLQLVKQSA